ncbi:MAG TPA: TolC family protein [Woeseiaceae bacterium]|nr:TolC family protein [Woeseiaceae bacterium]
MYLQPGHLPGYFVSRHVSPISLLPVLALLAVSISVHAQQDVPLTLAVAEDLAFAAEPGIAALQARAAAMSERAELAGELPEPSLRFGLNNYPYESGNFTTEGMTSVGIAFHQAFPGGDTREIGSQRYASMARGIALDAETRMRNVRMAVQYAWLDRFYWERAYALVIESRPFFEDLATISRSLYSVGRKSQQDVLRSVLQLRRLEDRLIDIDRQRAQAIAGLAEWIGIDAERPLPESLPSWHSLPPLEDMQARLESHPSLAAADAEIDAQNASVDLADERSRPGWALDVAYNYRDGYLAPGEPRSDLVSLNVTVGLPVLRKRALDSELSLALSERSAARFERERLLRSLASQLRSEYARRQELMRRISLYDESIIPLSKDHAQAALLAYQSERGDFADVMRAYIDDLDTRIEFVHLQVEQARSNAALANLGGLAR